MNEAILKIQDTTSLKKDLVENDPFVKYWKDNYLYNYINKFFNKENTKPFMFLVNTKPYSKVPIVLVNAGPSLDKNIKLLKDYQKKCIIICADVVFFKLVENDIKVDFVINLDPSENIVRFWEGLDTSNTILICPTTTHPKTIEYWKGNIFLYNQIDLKGTYKGESLKKIIQPTEKFGNLPNKYFVGATMLQIASLLCPTIVLLIGWDFAFTDGKAYCDGFLDRKIYDNYHEEGSKEYLDQIEYLKSLEVKKEKEIKLPDGKIIYTLNNLELYKRVFLRLVLEYRVNVINTTEGGILTELPQDTFKSALEEFCKDIINKKDVFVLPKRKRHKKRR